MAALGESVTNRSEGSGAATVGLMQDRDTYWAGVVGRSPASAIVGLVVALVPWWTGGTVGSTIVVGLITAAGCALLPAKKPAPTPRPE